MSESGKERRKAKRREIVEQFSFYICVPKLGYTRHKVNDVSELGIGFEIDTLGEFRMNMGETCDLQLYLNQSLFLTLKIEVVRHIDKETTQEVGAVFTDSTSPAFQTFLTLVKLLDQLSESAQTQPT